MLSTLPADTLINSYRVGDRAEKFQSCYAAPGLQAEMSCRCIWGWGVMLHTHALNREVGSAYREEKDGERLLVFQRAHQGASSFSEEFGRRWVYLISGLLKR